MEKVLVFDRIGTGDEWYVDERFGRTDVTFKRITRDKTAINVTIEAKVELNSLIMSEIKVYKLDNVEYKETAISFKKKVCDSLSLVLQYLNKHPEIDSNLKKCPLKIVHITFHIIVE